MVAQENEPSKETRSANDEFEQFEELFEQLLGKWYSDWRSRLEA